MCLDEDYTNMNEKKQYLLMYKPFGVVSAFTDKDGHTTLKEYIPVADVYPAGRLDLDSEGLLFLSNDGLLMHRMTDPAFEHPKTYFVQVEGIVSHEALGKLEVGIEVKGKTTRRCQAMVIPEPVLPERAKLVTPHGPTTWLRIVLREGKKRQIRHMTAAVGHPTLRLVRIALGPLSLGDLKPGEWRKLDESEIALLVQTLGQKRISAGQTPEASLNNTPGSRYRSGARRSPIRGSRRNGGDDPRPK
jgi:23S rRNA pseudouridine2457 synthase